MPHKNSNVRLVKASTLENQPKAFQDYVNKYFELRKVGGIDYFFAFTTPGFSTYNNHDKKGVAPAHHSNLLIFKDGLDPGQNLAMWINRKLEDKNQTDIVDFQKTWNDGDSDKEIED